MPRSQTHTPLPPSKRRTPACSVWWQTSTRRRATPLLPQSADTRKAPSQPLLSQYCTKMISLPRQARGKRRERALKKRDACVFCRQAPSQPRLRRSFTFVAKVTSAPCNQMGRYSLSAPASTLCTYLLRSKVAQQPVRFKLDGRPGLGGPFER